MPIKKKSTKRSPANEKIILLKRQASYYEEIALQYSHELKELQHQHQQWEEREKEYQQQLKEIRQTLAKYQEMEAEWRDKLADGTQQIRDLETKIQQQAKILNQKEGTIAHYKEKVEKLNKSDTQFKVREFEQALQEKQKIIEDYQEKEREWEKQLEQAKLTRKQEIARQKAEAAQKIQLLEQELAEAVASHTAAQETLSKQLEEKDSLISKLQLQESNLMKTIESLKNMHAQWQEKEKKYKESIQEFTAKEARSPKTGIPIQQTVHSSAKSIPATSTPSTSIQMPTQSHATYLKPHQTPHTHPINPFKPTE